MKRSISKAAVGGVLAAWAAGSAAIEPPKNVFLLWSAFGDFADRDAKTPLNLDLDPVQPGIEAVGLAEGCAISARDAEDKITVTYKLNFSAKTADGSATVFSSASPSLVTSLKFPDPRVARFQCGGELPTDYGVDGDGEDRGIPNTGGGSCGGSGNGFDPNQVLCGEFPQVFNVGAGIATKGTSRFFLVGNAIRGIYRNSLDDVDVSRFNVAIYDLNGTRLATKTFGAFDSAGFFLQWQLSTVGDYLANGSNVDEIRLMYVKPTASNLQVKYVYYDVQTGAQIGTPVVVSTPCPGPCRED
jgi:hypothetical protein